MSSAVYLVIIGLVVCFIAFGFAALNMMNSATNRNSDQGTFKKHLAAMIVIAFGGLLSMLGIVLAIVDYLDRVQ